MEEMFGELSKKEELDLIKNLYINAKENQEVELEKYYEDKLNKMLSELKKEEVDNKED